MISHRNVITRDGNSYLPIEGKWILFTGPLFTTLRRHIIENRHPQHTFTNGDTWLQFNFQASDEPLPRVGFTLPDGQLPPEGRYASII